MRLLIVDDDVLDRQAARRTLLATGMVREIAEAERGGEALERLSESEFDAVLLDYQLPDADGLEILREMRDRGVTVPVIVLTGYGDDVVAAELIKAGAADYFSKSRLSPDLIGQSLRHVLRLGEVRTAAEQAEAERSRLLASLADAQGQTEAILSSMTDGLVVCDLSGTVVTMNPAALAMHGFQSADEARLPLAQFLSILEVLSPEGVALPLSEWPLALALRGQKFSHLEVSIRRLDTGRTWIGSFGGTPVHSKNGEIILAVVTIRDITESRQAERRTALLADAGARLSASLDAQTTLDTVAQFVVPALADWCAVHALGSDDLVRPLIMAQAADAEVKRQPLPPDAPLDRHAAEGIGYVLRTGTPQLIPQIMEESRPPAAQDDLFRSRLLSRGATSYLCVPLIVRGQVLGALSLASMDSRRVYAEQDLALATELGLRVAAGLENVRLFDEVRARAEREAMINKIGSALRVSLDGDEILHIVTEQVGLALNVSRCRFLRLNAARDTLESAPPQFTASGVSSVIGAVSLSDWPREIVDSWVAGHAAVLTENAESRLACPVFLRGQFGGVFFAEQTDAARVWSRDEETFLCAITDILALALENARLYAREHRVADMLSSAFLTDIPDVLPGLALAANYRAGLEESQVGGDYYDAFSLPDGRVALVMADVSGKGLKAAVQTATVKYSLRAFATEAGAPGLVMTRLNRMLCSELAGLDDHFVTLFYAVFAPATGRLTWASAGHESVLIKRSGGGSTLLDANGPILGLAEHAYAQASDTLAPGDSLLLYTDGLTEARDPETHGLFDINGVRQLVEKAPAEAGPGALASYLQQAAMRWAGGRPQDDMALLVVQRLPPTQLGAEAQDDCEETEGENSASLLTLPAKIAWGRGDDNLFDFHFPSLADYVVEVRQALGHWMSTLGFDLASTEDFQTAVTEAVTNAVRHGSPAGASGEFHVLARRTDSGALHVEVTDSGLGLPNPKTFPLMPEPEAMGGRGLPLMQELADTVEFRSAPLGLCVVLTKRLSEPASS